MVSSRACLPAPDDDDTLGARRAELMDTEPEDRRGDGSDGHTAQAPFVTFGQLACIGTSGCLLPLLGDPVGDDSTAAVRHRGDVLREVSLRQPARRRKAGFPVEVVRFRDALAHRFVDHLVGERSRRAAKQPMQTR